MLQANATKCIRHPRPTGGAIAVEFALVMLLFLAFVTVVADVLRVSLIDQALARVTHAGALAAGRNPGACETAIGEAFEADGLAAWLFDRDGNGRLGFLAGSVRDPDGSANEEVGLVVRADRGGIADGVRFDGAGSCGAPGSWIEVWATVPVRTTVPLGRPLMRSHSSWAVNQR